MDRKLVLCLLDSARLPSCLYAKFFPSRCTSFDFKRIESFSRAFSWTFDDLIISFKTWISDCFSSMALRCLASSSLRCLSNRFLTTYCWFDSCSLREMSLRMVSTRSLTAIFNSLFSVYNEVIVSESRVIWFSMVAFDCLIYKFSYSSSSMRFSLTSLRLFAS